jgi:hypothetical protein
MMHEKSLLIYWAGKGHNARTISAKKESGFGSPALTYSWVTEWLRALKIREHMSEPCEHSGRPQAPSTGLRVLLFLNSTPFASIRQIATDTKIPHPTVLDHLIGWGYTVQHLKWVLHHPIAAVMEQQVELFRELLVALRSAKNSGWTQFITVDK